MKITLRKANALQQNINEALRGIRLEPTVSITEFEDVITKIDEANELIFKEVNRQVDLNLALYTIRGLVGQANSAEIDGLLTQIAHNEKMIALNNHLLTTPKRVALDVLKGKLEKIKSIPEDAVRSSIYGRTTEVSTGVFSDDAFKAFKTTVLKLKKEKQKLQDKVLELNIKTEIELPEDVVAILKAEDLV